MYVSLFSTSLGAGLYGDREPACRALITGPQVSSLHGHHWGPVPIPQLCPATGAGHGAASVKCKMEILQ